MLHGQERIDVMVTRKASHKEGVTNFLPIFVYTSLFLPELFVVVVTKLCLTLL